MRPLSGVPSARMAPSGAGSGLPSELAEKRVAGRVPPVQSHAVGEDADMAAEEKAKSPFGAGPVEAGGIGGAVSAAAAGDVGAAARAGVAAADVAETHASVAGVAMEAAGESWHEECGVFGIWGHPDAAQITYYGLHALQHRGQESAGIVCSDGQRFTFHRGMGLVTDVFDAAVLQKLRGDRAIGHVRYTTNGASVLQNAQPLVFNYRNGELAVATNGALVNADSIRRYLERQGSIFQTTSDTETIAHLIARSAYDDVAEAVKEALQMLKGAYAFLIMTNDKLVVALDPNGLRPLSMGRLGGAWVFASETCAFDTVGATFVRDVEPGELIVLDEQGIHCRRFASPARRALCTFEYIYFARPDSDIDGVNVHMARKRMGKRLAEEAPVEADVVTGVPDSSISAAIGFAEASGIPYEMGLVKNRYVGRTFIRPSQALREQGVKMKLSAVRKVVEGKRVVMIDDSIVRGTTSRRIVRLLREAGAKEVHVRISSPMVKHPCFYGVDTTNRKELVAADKDVEAIRQLIGADSLAFLSLEGMLEAIGRPAASPADWQRGHCLACFTGDYPTEVYEEMEPLASAARPTGGTAGEELSGDGGTIGGRTEGETADGSLHPAPTAGEPAGNAVDAVEERSMAKHS